MQCPLCKSKDIHHSEESVSSLSFNSTTPIGIYIWCKTCYFSINRPNLDMLSDVEKLQIFSDFVDKWNSIQIKED